MVMEYMLVVAENVSRASNERTCFGYGHKYADKVSDHGLLNDFRKVGTYATVSIAETRTTDQSGSCVNGQARPASAAPANVSQSTRTMS